MVVSIQSREIDEDTEGDGDLEESDITPDELLDALKITPVEQSPLESEEVVSEKFTAVKRLAEPSEERDKLAGFTIVNDPLKKAVLEGILPVISKHMASEKLVQPYKMILEVSRKQEIYALSGPDKNGVARNQYLEALIAQQQKEEDTEHTFKQVGALARALGQ